MTDDRIKVSGVGFQVSASRELQDPVLSPQSSELEPQISAIQHPASSIQHRVSSIEHPVPIIAMTAHAMAGDADKSVRAGMDDHITKPIHLDQLFGTLQKWIKPHQTRTAIQISDESAKSLQSDQALPDEVQLPEYLPGFDLSAGLKRLLGNRYLYRRLLSDFGARYQFVAAEIREALNTDNLETVHRLVHNLKGPAGNLAASDLLAAAIEMEELVRKKQTRGTPSKKRLDQGFSKLETALNQALESASTIASETSAGAENDQLSLDAIFSQAPELSGNEINRILQAAKKGDIEELIAVADELQTRSNAYKPLCERLKQLTENLDFEEIVEMVG